MAKDWFHAQWETKYPHCEMVFLSNKITIVTIVAKGFLTSMPAFINVLSTAGGIVGSKIETNIIACNSTYVQDGNTTWDTYAVSLT